MTKSRKRSRRTKQQKSAVSPLIIAGVAIVAVLVVVGLIFLGNQSTPASGPLDVSEFPAKGDTNAPVTIVEYSDFGCPHCRDFVLDKANRLVDEFVDTGKVRYVVHPYHLGSPDRALAAEAAWCAADQDRFFEFQSSVYQNFGNPFTETYLTNLAGTLDLDQNTFADCLSSRTHRTDVESARRAAARLGVDSTPTFFVNDQRVEGNQPYEVFQRIIDQELATAQ